MSPEDAMSPMPHEVVVRETGKGYAQEIRAGRHLLRADEPVTSGGSDTGPDPYALLLSALGACTAITIRMYANRKAWPLEGVTVRLSQQKIYARDCEECETKDESRIDRIMREVELAGALSAEQKARLVEIAEKCPVHRTLLGEKQIVTRLSAA
jgi:putative redox protein